MEILAIETSCDDTCVAMIKTLDKKGVHFKILSNITSSQIKIHRKWGGVYPSLAKREHQKNLVPVLRETLGKTKLLKKRNRDYQVLSSKYQVLQEILKREDYLRKKLKKFFKNYQRPEINLIAITIGPGLEPCLWVGINFARALAFYWELPVVPINHIEAHILANFITRPGLVIQFPVICLVVSGGHTQLILMKNYGKYKILGETRDDAAGECFDKVARILGMGYPGGPAIEAEASKFQTRHQSKARCWTSPAPKQSFWCGVSKSKFRIRLPRPMIYHKNYDFSFSGLKTAVLYHYQNQPRRIRTSKKYIQEMSAEVQKAVIDVLIYKTIKAAKEYKARSIILGGGVVANKELSKQFKKKIKEEMPETKCLIPSTEFCTDNAVMVAVAGYFHWLRKEVRNQKEIEAEANIKIC